MRTPELGLGSLRCACVLGAGLHAQGHYGIGRPATEAEIAGWNIDIGRDGANLPAGSGSVAHGHEVFEQQCAACHGENGEGGVGDRLVGGQGTIATPKPIKTVGSYWPYAPTLFDYIRRAMPQNAPQSLSNDDCLCGLRLHPQPERPASMPMRRSTPARSARSRCRTGACSPATQARRQKSGLRDGLLTQPGC